MKTTFKKTMAALSAAAVVAASATVLAMPTSAAANSLTVGTVEITVSELEAANYEVSVPFSVNDVFKNFGIGLILDDGLTYVGVTADTAVGVQNGNFIWYTNTTINPFGTISDAGGITVTVDKALAVPGTTLNVTATTLDYNGDVGASMLDADENNVVPTLTSGAIVIVEDPTEAPTEAPTDAPTDAPVATPTPTTAPAPTATSTTKPSSSSSPKTGDALPIAGVAVAVAVIGGVALVSKKRK